MFDRQTGEGVIFPRSLFPFSITATVYFWRCVKHGGPYEIIFGIDVRPDINEKTYWPCGCSIHGGMGVTWNQPVRSHTTPEQLNEDEPLPDHATFMKPYYRRIV